MCICILGAQRKENASSSQFAIYVRVYQKSKNICQEGFRKVTELAFSNNIVHLILKSSILYKKINYNIFLAERNNILVEFYFQFRRFTVFTLSMNCYYLYVGLVPNKKTHYYSI